LHLKFFKSFLIQYSIYFCIGLGVLLIVEVGAMIYVNN